MVRADTGLSSETIRPCQYMESNTKDLFTMTGNTTATRMSEVKVSAHTVPWNASVPIVA